MGAQYTNRELREKFELADAHSKAVIAAVHDAQWLARAAAAAAAGGAEALRAELHASLMPRRAAPSGAAELVPVATPSAATGAGGGAGTAAATAGVLEVAPGAAAATGSVAAGMPARALPHGDAVAPGKARPFI